MMCATGYKDCFSSALKLIWYVPFHLDYAHTKGQSEEILLLVKLQQPYPYFSDCKKNYV